jgi:excisionase family DNA binding protein
MKKADSDSKSDKKNSSSKAQSIARARKELAQKDMLTTEEAGAWLGISPGRIRQMILDGQLAYERFGVRGILIPMKEVIKAEDRPPRGRPTTKS